MGMFSAAMALFGPGGAGQQKQQPEPPSNAGVETRSTILVINDDPVLLETVKTLLVERGFDVLTSTSVPRGLGVLRNTVGDIRVVVLDCNMPKLNGEETFTFVRCLRTKTKVIGLTAGNLDSTPQEHLDGVDKLLRKPVVATELLGAVDELLGGRRTVSAGIES